MGTDLRVVVDAQTAGFQRGMDGVLARFGQLRKAHVETAATTGVLDRQTRQLTRELDRQSRSLALLTLQWTAFRRAMMTAALQIAVTGFAALSASVVALAGEIVKLTTSLGAFAGALGVVGASSMLAFAQGAMTAVLALKGVSKALTTTGTDHEKAMAKLTKPARAFVHEIQSMQVAFREVKLLAQQGLFTGLTRAVRTAKPLLEPFKQVIYDTATALGYLSERVADVAVKHKNDLKAMGERNVVTLRRMGDAAINFGDALINVFRAADPLIGHITRGIVTFSQHLRDAAAKARANGGLGSFFGYLKRSWDAWTSVAGNLGRTLAGVLQAASVPALDMAHAIDRVTEKWAKFTNSTRGQKTMGSLFENSNRVMGAFAHLLGDVVAMLARLSGPGSGNAVKFFELLDQRLLPIIEAAALQFNRHLFPAFMQLLDSVLQLVREVLPGLEKIANGFAAFVRGVSHVVDGIRELTDGLAPLPRALAALALGAGLIAGWHKLGQVISVSVLALKRFLGMAPEMAIMKPGLAMILSRGGKLDTPAATQQGTVPPMAIPIGGGRGGAPGRAPAPRYQITGGNLYRDMPAGFRGAYANRGSGVGRIAPVTAGPINPLTGLYQTQAPRPQTRAQAGRIVTPARIQFPEGVRAVRADGSFIGGFRRNVTTAAGPRTQAYRDFQNTNTVANRGRVAAAGDMTAEFARQTKAGMARGATLAKPVLGAAVGAAAISGIISGITSQADSFKGRIQDAVSGATFGIVESTSSKGQRLTKSTVASLASSSFQGGITGPPGQLTSQSGLDSFRKNWVKALHDGKDITDEQFVALNHAVDQAKAKLASLGGLTGDKARKALALGLDFGAPVARVETDMERVKNAFDALAHTHGMKDLAAQVKANVSIINGELGKGTEPGRFALAKNFRLAAAAVRQHMEATGKVTKDGTALVRKYLIDALQEINPAWTRKQAGNYLHDKDPTTGKPINSAPNTGKARGGLARIPGSVGPDSVPMKVAGRNIVAAPGEDVAIFTRHQRAYLDAKLAEEGGLAGVFKTVPMAHNHPGFAKGGIVRGRAGVGEPDGAMNWGGPRWTGAEGGPGDAWFNPLGMDRRRKWKTPWKVPKRRHMATGGMVTGDTDYLPAVGAGLEKMARAKQTPIFVQSGRRTVAEQLALAPTRSATHPVAGPNGPHVRGIAADISPGRAVFGDVAGAAGLGFTVPTEPWHVQLLNALGAAVSGGGSAPQLREIFTSLGGIPGQLVNAGLDTMRNAAQSVLDGAWQAANGSGGGATGETGPPTGAGGSGEALMRSIAAQRGWNFADWWALDDRETSHGRNLANPTSTARLRGQFLDMNYGKYGPGSDPAQSPSMSQQIEAMAAYIADRYTNPTKALAFHLANNYYGAGGLVHADVGLPPRDTGTPTVNSNDAITPKSRGGGSKKKTKKKAKPKAPFTGGRSYPNLSKITGGKVKPKRKWATKYSGWDMPEGADLIDPGLLPDFDALFDSPAKSLGDRLDVLAGQFGLSTEEAVVTLTDSGSFKDLTAFWDTHPDLAATWKGQIDSWDVVNFDGMNVQGRFKPGINQHVDELRQLLALHTGSGDGTGSEGLVGLWGRELTEMGHASKRVGVGRDIAADTLKQIRHAWNAESQRRAHAITKVHKLNSGGQSWEQRVGDNKARIDAIQDWKRDVRADTVGHRQTEALKKQLVKADQDIADLQDENTKLEDTKPPPKTTLPKNATKAQKAAAKKADVQRAKQLGHWKGVRDSAAQELTFLDGSRDEWTTKGGAANAWKDRLDAHNSALADLASNMQTLSEVTLPSERTQIQSLMIELGDWLGTSVILPNAPTDDSAKAINDLLRQQNEQLQRQHAVDTSQFKTFAGFMPLLNQRLVGAFAHGGVIPETGLALVHKGETVTPAPDGPYFNTAAAGGAGRPMHVELIFGDRSGELVRLIDARVDGRAAQASSQQNGRRASLIARAPGRG